MRSDAEVKTAQINPERCKGVFEKILNKGEDILFVGLSSGVSGGINSARIAADELLQSHPQRKIFIADSLGADMGEGLCTLFAHRLMSEGADIETAWQETEKYAKTVSQVFTVDDLKYLKKSGRISPITAKIATVLNIKPLLYGSFEGKIESFAKIRGRQNAINTMFESFRSKAKNPDAQTVYISQADCLEDAQRLRSLILSYCTPKSIEIISFEPSMTCHVGPGALALFFEGDRNF
jgi:DegV family protein with EDD domain